MFFTAIQKENMAQGENDQVTPRSIMRKLEQGFIPFFRNKTGTL
jgi:hypothetical protein